MLIAALTSRSWVVPQSHVHSRTFSGILPCRVPQAEHSLDDGNHRSTTTRSRPYQSALYSSMDRSSVQLASEMARARVRFLSMFRTVRSSITIVWFSRTSRVVSLCRKSLRRSAIFAYTRPTLSRAFARFAPSPLALRERYRCALARRSRSLRSCRGLVIFSPVESVTRLVIPASMPTAALIGSGMVGRSSHSMETNQRPAAS